MSDFGGLVPADAQGCNCTALFEEEIRDLRSREVNVVDFNENHTKEVGRKE